MCHVKTPDKTHSDTQKLPLVHAVSLRTNSHCSQFVLLMKPVMPLINCLAAVNQDKKDKKDKKDHGLYKRSGHSLGDVTHWFVNNRLEAASSVFLPSPSWFVTLV